MNKALKYLLPILLISFSSVNSFSQIDSTKKVKKETQIDNDIKTTGNYQLKTTTKVKPISNFELKIDKKLNTDVVDKNLNQHKSTSKNHNFFLEELPEGRDIIGKKYWKGKDVTHKKLESHLSLGTITSKTKIIKIECRDFGEIDGDRIRIYLNNNIVSDNIGLKGNFYVYSVNLEKGYNKIDFEALNQGYSGPNTSELRVYDDNGTLLTAKGWGLNTKQIATIGIHFY